VSTQLKPVKEKIMNDTKILNKRYSTIAWGALFLWLGLLMIVPGNQSPIFVLGAGIILLGLNLVRQIRGIPVSAFSITLGCLAIGLGLVAMFRTVLNIPPFELPLLPTVLIIIGLYVLIPGPKHTEKV
jgi:phosphatidylserine synthase